MYDLDKKNLDYSFFYSILFAYRSYIVLLYLLMILNNK